VGVVVVVEGAPLRSGLSTVAGQLGRGRVGPSGTHALLLVDVQAVVLDAQVVLQRGLGVAELLQGALGGAEAVLQHVHRLVDLAHLAYEPVLRLVPAQFHVGTTGTALQTGLSHLHGGNLIGNGLAQCVDVILHLVDLFLDPGQVGRQAVTGVHGLGDASGEGHVDRVVLRPHVVGRLLQCAVDVPTQTLGAVALPLRPQDVVVGELSPGLGHGYTARK
jgi:hypothetical protein